MGERRRAREGGGGPPAIELPPGQFAAAELPVVDLGVRPQALKEQALLEVIADAPEGEAPFRWEGGLEELRAIGEERTRIDLHGALSWSRVGLAIEGLPLTTFLDAIGAPVTRAMEVASRDGYRAVLSAEEVGAPTWLVWGLDGKGLTRAHGAPLRLVCPSRYAFKSPKWIQRLTLCDEARLSTKERAGWHPRGDPWREERFA